MLNSANFTPSMFTLDSWCHDSCWSLVKSIYLLVAWYISKRFGSKIAFSYPLCRLKFSNFSRRKPSSKTMSSSLNKNLSILYTVSSNYSWSLNSTNMGSKSGISCIWMHLIWYSGKYAVTCLFGRVWIVIVRSHWAKLLNSPSIVCLSFSIFSAPFSGLLDSSTHVMCATAAKTLGRSFSGCSFSLNKFIMQFLG